MWNGLNRVRVVIREAKTMFAFLRGKKGDLFERRKRQIEVCKRIRRIVDRTSPSVLPLDGELRSCKRYNRSIPLLVAEWSGGRSHAEEAVYGVTKDFSDVGLSLLLPELLEADHVICGLLLENAVFALGKVAWAVPFGGGFWQMGVNLNELLPDSDVEPLLPLVERLSPNAWTVESSM